MNKIIVTAFLLFFLVFTVKAQLPPTESDSAPAPVHFLCPVKSGKVTANFGKQYHPLLKTFRFHYGVDIQAKKGTPVYAIADGTVEFAGENRGYGNSVRLQHRDGYSSFYGHLDKILVQEGQPVKAGTVIGLVGMSGLTTRSQLHLEIRHHGEALNPLGFLNCIQTVKQQ